MKRWLGMISTALVFLASAPVWGEEPEPSLVLGLEECLDRALEVNAKLGAAEWGVKAARAQLTEASARFWPVLEYEYQAAPAPQNVSRAVDSFFDGDITYFNRLKVGVGIPLFASGQLYHARGLAKQGVAASRELQQKERGAVVYQVKQLYYGLVVSRELKDLLKRAYDALEKEIEKHKRRESRPSVKLLKLQLIFVEVGKRLEEVSQKEGLAKEGLRIHLGLDPTVAFDIKSQHIRPVKEDLPTWERVQRAAEAHLPEVQLLSIGAEAKRRQYKLEMAKMLPQLGAGGFFELGRTADPVRGVTATDDFNDPFNFTRAGVGLQLKGTLDIHGGLARVRKARSDYYKLKLESSIGKEALLLEVREAYSSAMKAKAHFELSKAAQRTVQHMGFIDETNEQIGLSRRHYDFESLQMMLTARAQYLQSVYDYNLAVAKLAQKMGRLPVKEDHEAE